ncbi:MAG: hypothetical protein ACYDCP_09340 [Thermoplasmataceae archaeon]
MLFAPKPVTAMGSRDLTFVTIAKRYMVNATPLCPGHNKLTMITLKIQGKMV